GGKYVEAMPDVAALLPPFSRDDVLDRLRGLRVWPLLQGVRGEPPADVEALVQAALRLGRLALATAGRIQSLGINPVLVLPEAGGAVAVEARVEPTKPMGGLIGSMASDTLYRKRPTRQHSDDAYDPARNVPDLAAVRRHYATRSAHARETLHNVPG